MSVHEDTLQGLKEALEYVNGDKAKARSSTVTIPEDDIVIKFNRLPEEDKRTIAIIIDKMLIASGK